MGEEIVFENGRFSDFQELVALTLVRVIPSCITRRPLHIIEIKQTFCGRTDGHLRPTLLGRLT